LVEAEVLYYGFTLSSCGGIEVPLIIARPLGVNIIIINNVKTSIKLSFSEKNVLLTLVVYMYIICGYQTSCHQEIWQKISSGKKILACLMLYISAL
jgi:hypothetical protein